MVAQISSPTTTQYPSAAKTTATQPPTRPAANDRENTEALHASTQSQLKAYSFQRIRAEDAPVEDVRKILKRLGVDGTHPYNVAALSNDTLVVATDGNIALKQFFGGQSSFSRGLYSVARHLMKMMSGLDRSEAARKYKEFFNASHNDNPEGLAGEPLAQLIQGLKDNHYHAVAIFRKGEDGKFKVNPTAVAIADSYHYLLKHTPIPATVSTQDIDQFRAGYKNSYTLDKVIPLDIQNESNFYDLSNALAEGLYAAQGYDMLTIQGKVHQQPNFSSDTLNFREIPWRRIAQNNAGHWTRTDPDNGIDLTVVRPLAKADEAIPELLPELDAMAQTNAGKISRISEEDKGLIREVVEADQKILSEMG